MELSVFITFVVMAFAFFANSPLETPLQAFGATFAIGISAFLGGAPLLAQALSAAISKPREITISEKHYEDRPADSYMRVIHPGRARFAELDEFYHRHGICCSDKEGECSSCLDVQVSAIRRALATDLYEFEARMKEPVY
ncbi:hypothetical protein F66182_665 [Fusarium sp. NRRL 66182]|nr:hypothetical protein F66182_665 [Fusarium sp. NRRL 66182]